MRKIVLAFALCAPLALGACSPQAAATVDTSVQAAEIGLTGAFRLALVYTSLPRCPATTICSDPARVAQIKSLATTAHDAVVAARSNAGLLSVALTAIQDLKSAIPAS